MRWCLEVSKSNRKKFRGFWAARGKEDDMVYGVVGEGVGELEDGVGTNFEVFVPGLN